MNRISLLVGLIMLVTHGLSASLVRAEEAASAPADAAAQAKAAFKQKFDAYKEAVRQIEHLRTDYQVADQATRPKINDSLGQHVAAMQTMVDEMVAAASDAYRLAPNTDLEVTDLLLAVARHYAVGREIPRSNGQITGGDQYERALPIVKLLAGGDADRPELPVWGFVCAMATNNYDLAEQYLKMAQNSGALTSDELSGDAAGSLLQSLALQLADSLDEEREKWAKESAIRAAEAEADDLPRVRLSTTQGEITLELFENEAPETVANFVTLVKRGFYNGLAFHRVVPKFMAQGGDPNGDGSGGPGYAIHDECDQPNARMHFRGSLSMAHAGRDTGGSQFFITFVPTSHLDGKHTVFGRVVDGIDVLADLQRREPNGNPAHDAALPKPDRILTAEVLRDRGHEYTFRRLPAPR